MRKKTTGSFLVEMGLRIKELREQNNLTQEELAKQVGLTSRSISSIESGHQEVSITNAHKISVAINTTLNHLFYGKYEFKAENIIRMLQDCPQDKIHKIEIIVRTCLEL